MTEQIQEVLQPTQPVQSVPIEPKKKSKFPLIVILVIVILLIGGGLVYAGMQLKEKQLVEKSSPEIIPTTVVETSLVPTLAPEPTVVPTVVNDETANWKTYKNTEFGFSFKYDPRGTVGSNEYESIYGGREIAIKVDNFEWFIEENKNGVLLNEFVKQNTNTTGVNVFPNNKVGKLNGTLAEFQGDQGQLDADYAHLEYFFDSKGTLNRLRLYLSTMDISAKDRENFMNILRSVELN